MDIGKLAKMQRELMDVVPHEHKVKDEHQGAVVAAFGIIEETLEYLNSIGFKSWRPIPLSREAQLEEFTDVLFFYLELGILGGFSPAEVEEQYIRKWGENMQRYEKGKKGDYSWNHRGEGGL